MKDSLAQLLLKSHVEADIQREKSPDHDHLASVLYDLYSYFSEHGTTQAQDERLEKMGFKKLA